jgi:hypothetical protein
MKRLLLLPALLVLTFCSSGAGPTTPAVVTGRGVIAIDIRPNPIVAQHLQGDLYEFPFDVVIRETGGSRVTVNHASVDVYALGGALRVYSESYDAAKIASLHFPTELAANGELRYHFAPRHEVPDERLFGGVTAEVRIDAKDGNGVPTTSRTTLTVTR